MQMFFLRSIMLASLALLVSGNVIEDLNCKAQTAAAEAQLQNEVFVEGLIRCLKRSFLLCFSALFFLFPCRPRLSNQSYLQQQPTTGV